MKRVINIVEDEKDINNLVAQYLRKEGYEVQIGIDRGNEMFEELGISFGTALIVLLALYFIIKWAVKNGIKEAYRDITGKVTTEDIEAEQICNEEEK